MREEEDSTGKKGISASSTLVIVPSCIHNDQQSNQQGHTGREKNPSRRRIGNRETHPEFRHANRIMNENRDATGEVFLFGTMKPAPMCVLVVVRLEPGIDSDEKHFSLSLNPSSFSTLFLFFLFLLRNG